ncbi:hypothetical protein CMT42_14175 [Elizabethkingia anophelis]|uniref:Uncharacterized protein n=1 Tax=Elizabethkingia anophelis TaxID=1117645 RepID=A0A1T3D8X1_9FLAO|nr:hypothetical protein BBD31_03150 [Elizabethkingia anophelis]AQX49256.1 hypothetical protein AYC66_00520 [Elizabethkingia anophelis]AQX87601.1 hypothetical protein AYC67_00525 [Elizabethkingia anophelis]ASV80151.1 hypothetical protein A6J37_16880 [Elizabethkingia anophelis]MDV2444127.1 hypothetical protein [Elizabethkingia anophelis]
MTLKYDTIIYIKLKKMEKKSFDAKSFLNFKEMSPREDLLVKGGGSDKKKEKQKDKKKSTEVQEK